MEAPYQFWESNSNLCQKKRIVGCRTWKVKKNRFGFSEGWRVLMNEDWDWDLHGKESCQKKVETYSVILCQWTGLTAAWSQHQDVGRDRGEGQELSWRVKLDTRPKAKKQKSLPTQRCTGRWQLLVSKKQNHTAKAWNIKTKKNKQRKKDPSNSMVWAGKQVCRNDQTRLSKRKKKSDEIAVFISVCLYTHTHIFPRKMFPYPLASAACHS